MTMWTRLSQEPRLSPGQPQRASFLPELLAILLLAALTYFRVQGTVDQDTSWQLWVAERLHHGARLYSDIMETNPPLWFWMALPVDSLAQLPEFDFNGLLGSFDNAINLLL